MLVRSQSASSLSLALPSPSPPAFSFLPLNPLPSPIMSPTSVSPLPPTSPPTRTIPYTSPTNTQPSTPKNKNYHPYLIQSTSSSLLTRSNSSPAQPISAWGHTRNSKSMNSLNQVLSGAGPELPKKKGEEEENRRRSMDSPSRPAPIRRSGTLPDFLSTSGAGSKDSSSSKELNLPLNPKTWAPSDLAQYLGQTLRTGGPDGHGQVLPAPLVEDIKSWVLRQRVSGRDFIRGSSDGWGSTRPPPFLPLLQSIARKLRRNSLGGRLDNHGLPIFDNTNPDDSFGRGSVLMEEDELLSEDDENEVTGVRRMAIAFDARSSASEASGDEIEAETHEVGKLKPQWTGESVGERWRKWEEKAEVGNVQGSHDLIGRKRNVSDASSTGGYGDVESCPHVKDVGLPTKDDLSPQHGEKDKSLSSEAVHDLAASSEGSPTLPGLTPPPPYTSSFPGGEEIPSISSTSPFATHLTPVGTPRRKRDRDHDQYSVTPTPERPTPHTSGLGIKTPDDSPEHTPSKSAMTGSPRLSSHTTEINPYATLRGSPSGPRHPTGTMRSVALSGLGDDDDEEGSLQPASLGGLSWDGQALAGSRWTTARRVTLKPVRVQNLFDAEQGRDESAGLTSQVQELGEQLDGQKDAVEEKMERMMERIKELEDKLEAATAMKTSGTPASAPTTAEPEPVVETPSTNDSKKEMRLSRKAAPSSKSVLDIIGLGSNTSMEEDGLPRRVRELPAYLFLVGVGVGAIMVRALIGRSR